MSITRRNVRLAAAFAPIAITCGLLSGVVSPAQPSVGSWPLGQAVPAVTVR